MRYRYVKAHPPPPRAKKPLPRLLRLMPGALITLGSVFLANVLWPLLSYQLFVAPQIRRPRLLSPIPDEQLLTVNAPTPFGDPANQQSPIQEVLGQTTDFTNARNWFPTADFPQSRSEITRYQLSIPAVNIDTADVEIGGESLEESLIHYPGSALPGQLGSPVIFGHSILRQFYAPQKENPRRYLSIFSKIMTLEEGDEIIIDYDGIRYTYEVSDKFEVEPEDIFILQQRLNTKELKLITCIPEGTYLRRGVVLARLVDNTRKDQP